MLIFLMTLIMILNAMSGNDADTDVSSTIKSIINNIIKSTTGVNGKEKDKVDKPDDKKVEDEEVCNKSTYTYFVCTVVSIYVS